MKKYNQFLNELRTSTYRKAGDELKRKGHITRGERLINYSRSGLNGTIEYVDTETGQIKTVNIKNITVNDKGVYDNDYMIFNLKTRSTKIVDKKSSFNLLKYLKYINSELYNNFTVNDLYKENNGSFLFWLKDNYPEDEWDNIKEIKVPYKQFTNLNGIENLKNLNFLNCSNNQLTNLNSIENLKNLKFLNCSNNQLTNLNLDNLINLEYLSCFNNQFTNLNLDNLTNLKKLYCYHNNITSLKGIENLTNLEHLYCSNNQLTKLNVKNLKNLKYFSCSYNQLTELDIKNLTNLRELYCHYNNISLSKRVKIKYYIKKNHIFSHKI